MPEEEHRSAIVGSAKKARRVRGEDFIPALAKQKEELQLAVEARRGGPTPIVDGD
jgi:hypothetical protein